MTLRRILPVAAALAAVLVVGGRLGSEALTEHAEAAKPEPPLVLPLPARPAPNPFLAPTAYAIPQADPARTGVLPIPVSRGTFRAVLRETTRLEPAHAGAPIPTSSPSPSPTRVWAVWGDGVAWLDGADGDLREVARVQDGGPGILDVVASSDGVLLASRGTSLVAYGADPTDPAGGLRVLRSLDLGEQLEPVERGGGLRTSLTYDGWLVVLAPHSLRVVSRDLAQASEPIRFGDGERAAGGVAVDERDGIFVVTDRALRRVAWTGSALSTDPEDGAWEVALDGVKPPGIGPASAPALMGFGDDPDKLVVLTSGTTPPRLLAYWRGAVPKGAPKVEGTRTLRLAGRAELTAPVSGEPSVAVLGYGAAVVGGADKASLDGAWPAVGVERFTWDPEAHAWRPAWSRDDVVSTGAPPVVSGPSHLLFLHGCTPEAGYELTGLDWEHGKTVHRTILGRDGLGPRGGAPLRFLPDGDLLLDGVGGPIRATSQVVETTG
jgi:hypothetical protein